MVQDAGLVTVDLFSFYLGKQQTEEGKILILKTRISFGIESGKRTVREHP